MRPFFAKALLILTIVLSPSLVYADAKSDVATAQENLAYTVGVQAYLYGQPIMDLYRTFWEGTLDPKRGHDRTLNEFNFVRKLVTPLGTGPRVSSSRKISQ